MQHKAIEYFDGEQRLLGELFYHEPHSDQQATVIVFPAFEGRGDFILDYAKKISAKGFAVFVADMYGNAEVASTIDGCFKLVSPLLQDRALVRRRACLAYETVLLQKQVDKNKIGAVGFCLGGMCVLELARSGVNLRVSISVHGVLVKSNLPTHLIKSKMLMLHGYKDPQVPPSELQSFAQEMEMAGVQDWTFTFFGNAKHSFSDPKTGTFDAEREKEMGREYNKIAAERSFQYVINFLQENLT